MASVWYSFSSTFLRSVTLSIYFLLCSGILASCAVITLLNLERIYIRIPLLLLIVSCVGIYEEKTYGWLSQWLKARKNKKAAGPQDGEQ